MSNSVVATIPDSLGQEDITLPLALIQTGMYAERHDNVVVFSNVRDDARKELARYVRSIGLECDPADLFWVL